MFDGVEYTGVVDRFRTERKRYVYHVTYSDGDEEELSQKELRLAYVLGLSPEIEAEWKWKIYCENVKGKDVSDNDGETSEGGGSVYGKSSEEDEIKKNSKRSRKKTTHEGAKTKKRARASGTHTTSKWRYECSWRSLPETICTAKANRGGEDQSED
jgi:hypothetical protein